MIIVFSETLTDIPEFKVWPEKVLSITLQNHEIDKEPI